MSTHLQRRRRRLKAKPLNISKAAQALADKHEFSPIGISGTGKNGQITTADVQKALDALEIDTTDVSTEEE